MSREELKELWDELARLRELHAEEFEKWWDMANAQAEKRYCFTGWLLDRKFQ
jgi:hypothetical protein